MDKFIGKRLDGRYEFKELIGIGGMANVYKAYDIVEQKDVAVKILKEEYQDNELFMQRFRNESKAVAALSHPNIVRIFDVNFGDRLQYIVMEYIDGITLKEFIEQNGKIEWKMAVHFTVQILRALQHAHDKGIVHRDIKSQNIMLLEDGTIKVMDFGIARFARDEKRNSGQAIGSVHYISPEQASGEMTDERSDIYSVGIIMYEMLTGTLPFDGNTPEEIAVKQMQSQAQAPCSLVPEIPEGLQEIVERAMQKSPSKRYQSAAEMLRDIDEFKRNPDIVFEYKYFDEGNTKYFNAIAKTDSEEEEEEAEEGKSKFIPILLGVSLTFVIIAAILIALMLVLKRPAPGDVVLDDFTGKNYQEIQKDERYKNNKFKIITEHNSEYDADIVFDQDPEPGISVKENSKITLYVSLGSQEIEMIDVTNLEINAAVQKLRDAGFEGNINKVQKEDNNVQENYVISSDPAKGEMIDPKATITLYYSYGKVKTVPVPEVTGWKLSDAKAKLEGLGLTVLTEKEDSFLEADMVLSQSPASGTVPVGSVVTLKVSSGTAPEQSVSVSLKVSSKASGAFTVSIEGTDQAQSVSMPKDNYTFTFNVKGKGETKTYNVMVTKDGKSLVLATVRVDFTKEGGQVQVLSQDNGVFAQLAPESSSSSSSEEPSSSDSSD